jgi:hypothetical protein
VVLAVMAALETPHQQHQLLLGVLSPLLLVGPQLRHRLVLFLVHLELRAVQVVRAATPPGHLQVELVEMDQQITTKLDRLLITVAAVVVDMVTLHPVLALRAAQVVEAQAA